MRIAIAFAVVATGFAGGLLAASEEPPASAAAQTQPLTLNRPLPVIPSLDSGELPGLAAERPPSREPKPKPQLGGAHEDAPPSGDAAPPPRGRTSAGRCRPRGAAAEQPAAPHPGRSAAGAPQSTGSRGARTTTGSTRPIPAPPTNPGDSYDTSSGD